MISKTAKSNRKQLTERSSHSSVATRLNHTMSHYGITPASLQSALNYSRRTVMRALCGKPSNQFLERYAKLVISGMGKKKGLDTEDVIGWIEHGYWSCSDTDQDCLLFTFKQLSHKDRERQRQVGLVLVEVSRPSR